METIVKRLKQGEYHFSSGTINSPEFNKFYRDFRKVFTKELIKLNATGVEFSKGHFYLTGFFKLDEQYYYFSLSDVRHGFGFNRAGNPEMLIRTAQHNRDYTGGVNNYVEINQDIANSITKTFRL